MFNHRIILKYEMLFKNDIFTLNKQIGGIRMCMYVITDSKGNYIRKDGDRYVPIKSEKGAMQWSELSKANNVLLHGLNNRLRTNYKVVAVKEPSEETVNMDNVMDINTDNIMDISFEESDGDNSNVWEKRLQDIFSFANDAQNRFIELNNSLSIVDKKITDVQHYIEFNKLNACEGWKCFNLLQSLLRERRLIKDEREILKKILDYGLNKKNMGQLCREIKNSKNKIYTPRALPELFSSNDIMSITV